MAKKPKTRKKKVTAPVRQLSVELDEQFAWFLEHVSPKHFSRALRSALVEFNTNIEGAGTPDWLPELADGLQLFFGVLDTAEDEGKYLDQDMYER